MSATLARDIESALRGRLWPVRVFYGPERPKRAGFDHAIVFERDRERSDAIEPSMGVQRNARRVRMRSVAMKATIYACSNLAGARPHEHEDVCDRLVDALIFALVEWCTSARGGELPISEARYLRPEEMGGGERWPGVAYMLRFSVARSVEGVNYKGEARPTATVEGFKNTTHVRPTVAYPVPEGEEPPEPETGCSG